MTLDTIHSVTLPIDGTQVYWVEGLPENIPDAVPLGSYMYAKPNELLVSFLHIARYRVIGGTQIEIALLSPGTHETAAFFLMATPFGALIHQRGELPLHASAVIPPDGDRALLIAGESGAGKSTVAATLAKRGWAVLNDDVSRICCVDGNAMVYPGFNDLKLEQQSCDLLDLDSTSLTRTRGQKQKYFWQPNVICKHPLPIAAIVELRHASIQDEPGKLQRETGSDAIQLLLRQTYRARLIRPLGGQMNHFLHIQKIASRHACYRITNTRSLSLDLLADRLETLV